MYLATRRSVAVWSIFAFFFLMDVVTPAYSQQMVFRSSDDNPVAMMEIPGGLVIVEGNEEARIVRRITPSGSATETPDLQEGDLIIYLNGTRIKSADQLKALYGKIEVAGEVKLGIQRGEDKMIRTYNRPENQNSFSSEGGGQVVRFESDGTDGGMPGLENENLWPAGFIVGEKTGSVVIGASLPIPNKAEALAVLKEGDIISSLDGSPINSVDALLAAYQKSAVGDDVTVEYIRADKTEKILFKKPEAPQMRMQIERN